MLLGSKVMFEIVVICGILVGVDLILLNCYLEVGNVD